MKPNELYDHIWNIEYNKSGYDLDWKIEVDREEKVIRLLFQPSMSTKDWVVNILGFLPVLKFPYAFTYGWKKVFDSCKVLILEELVRKINKHKGYTVEVSGHSYGGAMAVIAALELNKQTQIKANVVTFGAPKPLFLCLSMLIARRKLGNVTQYAHRSDIVTYMPPLIGYHNVKTVWLGEFHFKWLFDPWTYHLSYTNEELYK